MKTTLLSALCAISLLGLSFGQSVVETRNGGAAFKGAIVTKTAAYTAGIKDYTILVDASDAAVTISLPSAEWGRNSITSTGDSMSVGAIKALYCRRIWRKSKTD